MTDIQVLQVLFDPTGCVIAYQDLGDIRVGGAVVMQKQVRLEAMHPDYAEDIEALHRKAVKALRNALQDFEASPVYVLDADEDDDDDRGMGE